MAARKPPAQRAKTKPPKSRDKPPSRTRKNASGKTKAEVKGSTARKSATPGDRQSAGKPAPATFYVCRSCVWSEAQRERDGKRQGTFLLEAVQEMVDEEPLPAALNVRAVYCLNGCKSPCNVGFRAPGKHHVRFSRLTPENAADVIAYARAYQANPTGDVPEDEAPEAMRGKMTVRTPPIG
jgi:predicted metal-binding protein